MYFLKHLAKACLIVALRIDCGWPTRCDNERTETLYQQSADEREQGRVSIMRILNGYDQRYLIFGQQARNVDAC